MPQPCHTTATASASTCRNTDTALPLVPLFSQHVCPIDAAAVASMCEWAQVPWPLPQQNTLTGSSPIGVLWLGNTSNPLVQQISNLKGLENRAGGLRTRPPELQHTAQEYWVEPLPPKYSRNEASWVNPLYTTIKHPQASKGEKKAIKPIQRAVTSNIKRNIIPYR